MDPTATFCPNRACPARGHCRKGNMRIHSRKDQRFLCTECHKTCSATTGTALYRLRTAADTVRLIVPLLAHGCPLQASVIAFGFDERTGARWWRRAGIQGQAVQEHLVERPRDLGHVQADEIRVKVQGGIVWRALAIIVRTRWWWAGEVREPRDMPLIRRLIARGRACALHRPLLVCTDGLCSYIRAMRETLRDPVHAGTQGRPRLRPWRHLCIAQVIKPIVWTRNRSGREYAQCILQQYINESTSYTYICAHELSYFTRAVPLYRASLSALSSRDSGPRGVGRQSAGGRSNIIFRVPQPGFLEPMKGVIRMQYPHDRPPWTSQRTRALLRLFQTSAPPDFQRQILERVAQRQHARIRRRVQWRSPLPWWPGSCAWGAGTLRLHRRWPRRIIATAGCCGLVLGTSLVWWSVRTGPAVLTRPEVLVSHAVSLPPSETDVSSAAPMRVDHHEWFGGAERREAAVPTVSSPAPIDMARQMLAEKAVDRSTALQNGANPERGLPVPAPVSHLTAQKARHPPARLHTHRARHTRSAPSKVTRFHTRPGADQQAPS